MLFALQFLQNALRKPERGSQSCTYSAGQNELLASLILATGMAFVASITVYAQPLHGTSSVQIHEAEGKAKLQLEQAEQMLKVGQNSEALEILQRISDQGANRLIAYPGKSLNASFPMVRYRTTMSVVDMFRKRMALTAPDALRMYRMGADVSALKQLQSVRQTGNLSEAQQLVDRYGASSLGGEALLWLGDLYLQRGMIEPARSVFEKISGSLRAPIGDLGETSRSSLPWHFVARSLSNEQPLPESILEFIRRAPATDWGAYPDSKMDLASVWGRLIWCSLLDGDPERARLEFRFLRECYSQSKVSEESASETWVTRVERWFDESGRWPLVEAQESIMDCVTLAGNPQRNSTSTIGIVDTTSAAWDVRLPLVTGTADLNPAGIMRVGENANDLLVHHPVIVNDRVYVNTLSRIVAYDLKTGQPWPLIEPAVPLFDSELSEETFMPLGYPIIGVPRGTLTIAGNCLYARMGSPITGRKSQADTRETSSSYLIGLDLEAQGRLLPGYPLRLQGESWKGFEFEGTPLVIGNDLYAAVTQRNSVHIRRFVACFDAKTAQLKWRSDLIAASLPDGAEQVNLISHLLLSYSEGRLFFSTGLGAVAALNAQDGTFCWLVRYPQVDAKQEAYAKSQRFRFRDLAPPLIHRGMVVVAPPDCREIFAMDWSTGDLIWATDPELMSDAVHLLGVSGNQLIVSGDRLYWLDLYTGKQFARYPESGSDIPGHALPQPRGMGRGMLTSEHVYWPVSGEVLLFDAIVRKSTKPRMDIAPISTLKLGLKGASGVHVTANHGWLLLTAANRMMAFGTKR